MASPHRWARAVGLGAAVALVACGPSDGEPLVPVEEPGTTTEPMVEPTWEPSEAPSSRRAAPDETTDDQRAGDETPGEAPASDAPGQTPTLTPRKDLPATPETDKPVNREP